VADINDIQPTSLTHLIGNKSVIDQVTVALDAAFQDNTRFPHALLLGPPGMGKSTLASVISHEMAVPFHEVLGQNLRTTADLNNLLLRAEEKSIVHIDESHQCSPDVAVAIYRAIDQQQIMVRGGSAITALPLNDFTLLLSTTEEHDLLQPLRDRMRLTLRFDYLDEADLLSVAHLRANALGWEVEADVLSQIADRARGTPRIALRLLQSAHRVARAEGADEIRVAHLQRACELEQIDSLGLGFIEQRYLRLLLDGPRRVNVLASALGIPTKTLTTVQEPFLIRSGLIDKDDQSRRVLTPYGREHLRLTDSSES
jgi:Holliday junction DNA helicase RuvB